MLVLPNFQWIFVGEADTYRRRQFPLKFLHPECSDYPCYAFDSELSKAFDAINAIKTVVDLSEFETTIQKKMPNTSGGLVYEPRDGVELVKSTAEFIKDILWFIWNEYNFTKIRLKQDHILVLKVDGYREYLMGNFQLM